MKRIAVLISNKGEGTNLQAIIDGVESKKINAKVAVVISDKDDANGLQRAKKYNIHTEINPNKENLLSLLKKYNVDYLCLGGWKQVLLDEVLEYFRNRILNVHPGLIPDTMDGVIKNPDGTDAIWNKGKFTVKAMYNFLENKATYAGCSIHFLTNEFDFGPVLQRGFVKIEPDDTAESLYARVKQKENEIYVEALAKLFNINNLTVLVVDGGGRGAALVDKYGQSKHVGKILVAPGNDLMQINTKKEVKIFPDLKTTSVKEILEIAKSEKVDLVDVAQDNAIEAGLVDELVVNGTVVIGPTRVAGQIEWDKSWAREFMKKYDILSPEYSVYHSEEEALKDIKDPNRKWFVKASGLAEGKGAVPAETKEQLINAIKAMASFGSAGKTILIEEWKIGEEFSAFALCDGKSFKIVGYAQDHKRVNDGDKGSNTGGMGCVSSPLVVDSSIKYQVSSIMQKAVEGLKKEERPYKGVLYLGGMVVDNRVFVIEFNARWGDPEAEVILPSIQNDFFELADAIIMGNLKKLKIEIDKKVRVVVAAVAKGYPTDYSNVKGKKVTGIEKALKISGVKIYGAGIKKVGRDFVVNGGRVLYIVGEGENVVEAREKAYQAMAQIAIEGDNLHYRTDIGWRDLERLRK